MSHTLFDNKVLANEVKDIMNTKLNTRGLMTIDTSLQQSAGLKKVINKYTYTGKVEKLAKGAKNTSTGTVTFEPKEYTVERFQQTFKYNDMDAMQDPMVVSVGTKGMADVMVNDINAKYFEEVAKISNNHQYTVFNYDAIVDAIATLNLEVEEGMFVLMGADLKATIRKDEDFKSARHGEILYRGQFGTICGLPVVFSKLVPAETAYITTKEAIAFLVKKEVTVEQAHDVETKDNTVVAERHGLIALVDETKSVKMTKQAG